jgi:hypothetical protein
MRKSHSDLSNPNSSQSLTSIHGVHGYLPACLHRLERAMLQQAINPAENLHKNHQSDKSRLKFPFPTNRFFAGTAGPSKSTKFLNEVFDSYRGKSTSNQKSNFTLLILVPSR